MFTMVTPEGLFTPRRVPQGVLNAIGYIQPKMCDMLDGYIDNIWFMRVGDIVIWEETPETLLKQLLATLDRLLESSRFDAAHNAGFFRNEIK